MGDMASINIAAMGKLVSALSNAAADFPYDQWGFTSTLGNVNVDASPAQKLTAVIAWANNHSTAGRTHQTASSRPTGHGARS